MNWSFSLVNGKLAEVFFEKAGGTDKIVSHAFVKKSEYKTKKEKTWIDCDTVKVQLEYKNGRYKKINNGKC